MADDYLDIASFKQPYRPEKRAAMNELGVKGSTFILEFGQRNDLRADEIAWALLSIVTIVLRNRGGAPLIGSNLASFGQKCHEYATLLRTRQAQPTNTILEG